MEKSGIEIGFIDLIEDSKEYFMRDKNRERKKNKKKREKGEVKKKIFFCFFYIFFFPTFLFFFPSFHLLGRKTIYFFLSNVNDTYYEYEEE